MGQRYAVQIANNGIGDSIAGDVVVDLFFRFARNKNSRRRVATAQTGNLSDTAIGGLSPIQAILDLSLENVGAAKMA